MKGLVFKGFAVAALLGVLAVPAASARSSGRGRLSVLPLPASLLGSAAKSLPLQLDSGAVPNSGLVRQRFPAYGLPVTPNRSFAPTGSVPPRLGRVGGYLLDYGLGASGGAGVTEVSTRVDEYKSSADAGKGLGFWLRADRAVGQWVGNGLSVAITRKNVAAVGSGRFALFVRYRDANLAPLFGLDEQFTEGRHEADVAVWAGTAAAVETLAPRLAKKLDARIKLALAGRLHATLVKLPVIRKPGPPPGGPDLAPLGLKTTDLTGQATYILLPRYQNLYPFALSEYALELAPAGPFFQLTQQIEWFPTANEASFTADFEASPFGKHLLDLSSLGDGARGVAGKGGAGLVFSSGRLEEYVDIYNPGATQTAQVVSLAQTVANKINAAALGS